MRIAHLAWLALGLVACPKTDPSSQTTTTTAAADAAPASSGPQASSGTAAEGNAVLAPLDVPGTAATVTTQPLTHGLVPAASTATTKLLPGAPTTTATSTAAQTTTATASPNALHACCSALHRQSQQPGPQAAQYGQAAALCDGLAAAMASTGGAAPQIEQIKPLLQGAQLPPLCQGL